MSAVTKHSSDIFRLLADPSWRKNSQPPLCSSNPPPFCSDDIISFKMLRIKMTKVTKPMKIIKMILEKRGASSLLLEGNILPFAKHCDWPILKSVEHKIKIFDQNGSPIYLISTEDISLFRQPCHFGEMRKDGTWSQSQQN